MRLSIVLLACTFALSGPVLAAESADEHDHHAHDPAGQTLELNAGQKWASDAPLREAMMDINRSMTSARSLIHHGQFGDAEYATLAASLKRSVAHAIEHCRLEPKADAMLHLILAELLAGAEIMEGKTANPRVDGAHRVLHTLGNYGDYFHHPGWVVARD